MDAAQTKGLLKAYGLKPKDYLGQNFLVDPDVLSDIVAAAELKPSDTVLEVGPGLGVLTEKLAERAKQVVAVEKDPKLASLLKQKFHGSPNVEIHQHDILRFYIGKAIPGKYKVVANIPYYLTSKLVANLLEQEHRPAMQVLMIQKEVAERIVAPAGELSILALSVNFFARPEIVRFVSRHSFWPVPEVDSAVIKITAKAKLPDLDPKLFFRLLHFAFAGKRKQLHNTLGKAVGLSRDSLDRILAGLNLDSSVRPQELTLDQWLKLAQQLPVPDSRK